jgi:hypothetical protein
VAKYSSDELKKRLANPGWRTVSGHEPAEGTLGEMAEAAHARHKNGHAVGYLQELETEIEVDMFQLQELWRHMGLPVI